MINMQLKQITRLRRAFDQRIKKQWRNFVSPLLSTVTALIDIVANDHRFDHVGWLLVH